MRLGIISSEFKDLSPSSTQTYEVQQLISSLKRKQLDYSLIDVKKITYGINNDSAFCRYKNIYGEEEDIQDIDVLLVRRTRDFIEVILDFIEYAQRANPNLIILDPLSSFDRPTSKVLPILKRVGLFLQPDTQVLSYPSSIIDDLEYPLIVKPTHGTRGEDTISFKSPVALQKYIQDYFNSKHDIRAGYGVLVQQELKKDNEFRVFVVGEKALGCIRKIPGFKGQVAFNYNEGAKFEEYKGKDSKQIKELAIRVSKFKKQAFSGVDIIESNGKYYVLECNRNPQFSGFDHALGIHCSDYMIDYIIKIYENKVSDDTFKNVEKLPTKKIKPKIFIGSSSNTLNRAKIIQLGLKDFADAVVWNQGVFEPSKTGFESIVAKSKTFDYAVFILSSDDLVLKNKNIEFQPRDNVLFEMGLFMGALGSDRVFAVVSEEDKVKLPSDFDGFTMIGWHHHTDGNIKAEMGPVCTEIEQLLSEGQK